MNIAFTVNAVICTIPGTITGNSDQADYKDTVLADIGESLTISNWDLYTPENLIPSFTDEYGTPGNYVNGANIAGCLKVGKAMLALGVI